MKDEEYINEQFREMVGLGYSVKEVISSLEEDMDVNQSVLKELLDSVK